MARSLLGTEGTLTNYWFGRKETVLFNKHNIPEPNPNLRMAILVYVAILGFFLGLELTT